MKKSLIALAALATVATAAQAQSSVTVYGVMDVGVGTINNVTGGGANTNTNKSWTGMTTGGEATSRFGLMGTEDLGGGLKANFKLESQILPTTGEVGSTSPTSTSTAAYDTQTGTASASSSVAGATLFDRNATVGLSGAFGTVNLGRQNQVMYDKLVAFDPRSYGNFAGFGSMGANKMSRLNNAVKYNSPVFNGFSVDALYSTSGVAGNSSAGEAYEGAINYSSGPLKATYAYSQLRLPCNSPITASTNAGNTAADAYCTYYGAANDTGNTVTAGHDGYRQQTLAGSYTYGDFTGIAGWLQRSNASAKNAAGRKYVDLFWAGVKYQVNPANLATVAYYALDDKTVASGRANMIALDYQYSLSKRTVLYAVAGFVQNDASTKLTVADQGKVSVNNTNNGALPVTGSNQTGYTVGVKHTF